MPLTLGCNETDAAGYGLLMKMSKQTQTGKLYFLESVLLVPDQLIKTFQRDTINVPSKLRGCAAARLKPPRIVHGPLANVRSLLRSQSMYI